MKEIVILSEDPDKSIILQTLTQSLFPECKTRVLAPGVEAPGEKVNIKGVENGKCPNR